MRGSADLGPVDLAPRRAGHKIGSNPIVLQAVDSTMDEIRHRAADGAPHGTVVIADHQRRGRGRLGRLWVDEPGTSLLMSVLLECRRSGTAVLQAPMAVALATLKAIEMASGPAQGAGFGLKWPNDLVTVPEGAKIGGLLAEAVSRPDGHDVVVGLGLNVHQRRHQLPPGAASLATEGLTVGRGALAGAILDALEGYWGRLDGGQDLVAQWRDRLVTLGREVIADAAGKPVRGRAVDVTPSGALVLETADGRRVEVLAGDVTLSGP